MKRLAVTLCVLGFINLSQAQTKEETIAWIKEKLERYGGNDFTSRSSTYTNVKVSPCSISFILKYSDEREEYEGKFNPSLVKSWKVGRDVNYIYANTKVIHLTDSFGQQIVDDMLFIRNGEPGIHNRIVKALLHLSTFCEETKKEVF